MERDAAMAPARRSAPIFLLSSRVDPVALTDDPGHRWTKIECASKKAYGCGEHGQEVVEGLKLYVRLGDDPILTSYLAIRMSDTALGRVDSELELGCTREKERFFLDRMEALATVQMAEEQDFTVVVLIFRRDFHDCELTYYLVYDHIGKSLSMINYIPDPYASSTLKPVLKRRYGSGFDMFVMARAHESSPAPYDVLCLCTPETRANPASSDSPWQIRQCFQFQHGEIHESFSPDVVFSLQGKGFWADLSQGLLYCDLHTISPSEVVGFGFIGLPPGCQVDMEQLKTDEMASYEGRKLTRTMGCVRDTIWFVCIDAAAEDYAHDLVKMWTLKVPEGEFHKGWWKKTEEVSVSDLWELHSFKAAGLPKGRLQFPLLTADGALSVVLPDQSKFPLTDQLLVVDNICIFDFDERGQRLLLWHGLVHDYPFTDPVVIPSNFLQGKHTSHKQEEGPCLPSPSRSREGHNICSNP